MRVKITYIYHSCFIVELDEVWFLFDYPKDSHLPEIAKKKVLGFLEENKRGYVFFSHGHDDHFNENIEQVLPLKNIKYVLSDDIEDLYGDVILSSNLVVEPDKEYELDQLKIKTFLSNDLGVAYLITYKKKNIYFGGDLASWIWPNIPDKAKEETENYFKRVLYELSKATVHIGFSNVDFRLENLGGGKEFVEVVRPIVFVPMHLFSDPSNLEVFVKSLDVKDTIIFEYKKIGDVLEIEI